MEKLLRQFRTKVDSPLRRNKFFVKINFPPKVKNLIGKDLIFFCDGVQNLPTQRFDNNQHEIRPYGIGLFEKFPTNATFEPLVLQFISDNNGLIFQNMKNLLDLTIMHDTSGGDIVYGVSYKSDYKCPSIDIAIYDDEYSQKIVYKCHDAHLTNITGEPLTWRESNEYLQIIATFEYTHYTLPSNGSKLVSIDRQEVTKRTGELLKTFNKVPNGIMENFEEVEKLIKLNPKPEGFNEDERSKSTLTKLLADINYKNRVTPQDVHTGHSRVGSPLGYGQPEKSIFEKIGDIIF